MTETKTTTYGIELAFIDGHHETSWWYGEAHGFDWWYHGVTETFHPNLVAKRRVAKVVEQAFSDWVEIR